MSRCLQLVAFGVLTVVVAGGVVRAEEKAKVEGKIFEPQDGTAFDITEKDIVRFTGPAPGSTGIKTTVKVTEGKAKVMEWAVYKVVKGKPLTIGGGALEFDVKPEPGMTGTVKVTVTTTPPGGNVMTKDYEFVVK
jgi:hypothetical protein